MFGFFFDALYMNKSYMYVPLKLLAEKFSIHFEYSQSSLRRTAQCYVWCYDAWCFPIEKTMERALADSLESNLNQENEAELQTFCSTFVQDRLLCKTVRSVSTLKKQ